MQTVLPVSKAFVVWSIVHSDSACSRHHHLVHPQILTDPKLGSSLEDELRMALLRHGNDRDWLAELLRRGSCATLCRLEPEDLQGALTALRRLPLMKLATALMERPEEDHTDLFPTFTAPYLRETIRTLRREPPPGVAPMDVLQDFASPGLDFHRTVWVRDTRGTLILLDGHHRILSLLLNRRPLDLFALCFEAV